MKKGIGIFLTLLVCMGFIWVYPHFFSKTQKAELVLYGNVDIREVDLGFRVFGKVKQLYFEEGDRVKKGDLLAELDSIPYQENLQLSKAQKDLAQITLENAKKQLERRSMAIKTSAISREDFENSAANVGELKATLEQSEASYAIAQTSYEDTKLHSPCDGVLLSRIREPGSILNPGQPVYTLALDAPIWIRAYISEVDLGRIFPGMKVFVFTDTATNPVYEGQIGFISPVAEFTPKNVETTDLRTELVYRIRVLVQDPNNGLRQGMPVTLKVPL